MSLLDCWGFSITLIRVIANKAAVTCPPKPSSEKRPLLGLQEARELAGLFEVLASDTRLRLLHALMILDDPCMSDLAEAVGMKPQAVSNQLRKLVDLGILDTRRHGRHIHYRIVEPCVMKLLHHGLCLNEEQSLRRVRAS
jgi:DNA-binding transcriptional ArsR family regulator